MKKQFIAVIIGICVLATAAWAQEVKAPAKQPQAKTQQEYDALVKFRDERDFDKQMATGEQFAKDFPASEMLVPFVYTNMMLGYLNHNNYEKTVNYGTRIIAVDPGNLIALFYMAVTIPERIKDEDLDRQQRLDQTTTYAKKLLEITATMQKPLQMTDDQWKAQLSQLQAGGHSALAFVALLKKDYAGAITEFKKSLELDPKDTRSLYRLGIAQFSLNQTDEAIKTLARCVALNGPEQARPFLERMYKDKNKGSLEGLDKIIGEVGQPAPK
jgi:tetratricopeptide (TPR) repeat protein